MDLSSLEAPGNIGYNHSQIRWWDGGGVIQPGSQLAG